MDWGVIIAALVTAVGGIVTTLLLKVRKENTNDHASVMEILRSVGGKAMLRPSYVALSAL